MSGLLIAFDPVLVSLGPLAVRWSALVFIASVAFGLWLTLSEARRRGVEHDVMLAVGGWVLAAGLVGAFLLHLVEHWESVLTAPAAALSPAPSRLSAWGAYLFGGLAFQLLHARERVPVGPAADAAAHGLALGEALVRFGQILDGDGQGRPAELPWATRYSHPLALAPDVGVPRHPAQAYQGLLDLLILALLRILPSDRLPPGTTFRVWLALYGLSRLLLGFLRLDPPFLLGLQLAQLIATAAVVVGCSGMIRLARRLAPVVEPPR